MMLIIENINDAPVVIEPLPDVTIDEDDFGAVIIPALEVYFNDVDEADILSYTGSALGEGLDSLSFSTDGGFTAIAGYHGFRIMTIKRSELKKRSVSKDSSPFQMNQERSSDQGRISKNEDAYILDARQNSSNSRTDSTALIVYPTENFVGDIDIMIIASDLSGMSVADTLVLTIGNIGDAPFVANAHDDILVYVGSEPILLYQQPNLSYWTGYAAYMQYAYSPDNLGVFDDPDMLSGDILTITAQPLDETLVALEYNTGGPYESASLNLFVENGPGETDIVLSATDIAGLSVSDTFHVTVAHAPSLSLIHI